MILKGVAFLAYAYRAKLIAFFVRCQVFFREVKAEMRKVTWPSKDEVVSSTVLVLVAVVFLAIVIGIEDAILAKVVQFVFVR